MLGCSTPPGRSRVGWGKVPYNGATTTTRGARAAVMGCPWALATPPPTEADNTIAVARKHNVVASIYRDGAAFATARNGEPVASYMVSPYDSSSCAARGFCTACGTHLLCKFKESGEYNVPVGLFPKLNGLKMVMQYFGNVRPSYYCFSNETEEMTTAEIMARFAPQMQSCVTRYFCLTKSGWQSWGDCGVCACRRGWRHPRFTDKCGGPAAGVVAAWLPGSGSWS